MCLETRIKHLSVEKGQTFSRNVSQSCNSGHILLLFSGRDEWDQHLPTKMIFLDAWFSFDSTLEYKAMYLILSMQIYQLMN